MSKGLKRKLIINSTIYIFKLYNILPCSQITCSQEDDYKNRHYARRLCHNTERSYYLSAICLFSTPSHSFPESFSTPIYQSEFSAHAHDKLLYNNILYTMRSVWINMWSGSLGCMTVAAVRQWLSTTTATAVQQLLQQLQQLLSDYCNHDNDREK